MASLSVLQALHDELVSLASSGRLESPPGRRAVTRAEQALELGRDVARVRWPGVGVFWLSRPQRAVVQVLLSAYLESRNPEVGQDVLIQASGVKARRLAEVFTRSLAWGTLILPGRTPGCFRLAAIPEDPPQDPAA